jgi:hypothetical protein
MVISTVYQSKPITHQPSFTRIYIPIKMSESPLDTPSSPDLDKVSASNSSGNGGGHALHVNDKASTYTDPAADVVLVSTNGRHFHVQSFYLKANRWVLSSHRTSLLGVLCTAR